MDSSTNPPTDPVIFSAKRVHTLATFVEPHPTAVAVANGRILGVGEAAELADTYGGTIDSTFADHVVLPGFVEAHSHSLEGGFWQFTYCGYFDRIAPDGKRWAGCKNIGEVVERLREAEAQLDDPSETLLAWGMDPIYFDGERLVAHHLDAVSATRPVFVMHASIHVATVNTALMERENIGPDTKMEGVPVDGSGQPVGELQEPPAMALAAGAFRTLMVGVTGEEGYRRFGAMARNAGITTLTDLGTSALANPKVVERWERVVEDPEQPFPARVSVFHNPGFGLPNPDLDQVTLIKGLTERSTDKLRFGHVKILLDGSIQGFTARLRWPGYHHTGDNGIWLLAPEQVYEHLSTFHKAGVVVHAHCNGDEAVDLFLDVMERVLTENPRPDHRHTIQHCQMTTAGQYRRMRNLGLCANIFANHTFFWGDQHASTTVGPHRAARMNAAATALRIGVALSMHSDAAVTPLGSLHVAWCAVNRLTASGVVLGPDERISVAEALLAVTLGAAYQLKMDDEIGTIEPGKRADFAVLGADPFETDPTELKSIPVWGTVLGGVAQPGSTS